MKENASTNTAFQTIEIPGPNLRVKHFGLP